MLIFLKGEVMRAKKRGAASEYFTLKAKGQGGREYEDVRTLSCTSVCVCVRGGAKVYLAWFLLDVWRV